MRKFQVLFVAIVGMLALSMISSTPMDETNVEAQTTLAGGRLVFVEDVTATWCGYCPAASESLQELSGERSDFRFITLVDDRVDDAATRNSEFNPSGFPSVIFDGGFEEVVGSQSSNDPYEDAIDTCQDRDAPDIDVDVSCFDEGASRLRIAVEITNNGGEDYTGRLLINIVEKISRYLDSDGNNYPNSLLGYAADESISISSGNTYSTTAIWVGENYEDMQGNDFSDIDPDNIVIYASVINGDSNLKVRPGFPPSYFTAYYVDNVGEAFPEELVGAPEVKISSPRNGRSVSGVVDIIAEVTSEVDIDDVEVKVGQDGWDRMVLDDQHYTYSWDTTSSSNGPVKISVRATDEFDLVGTAFIEVEVENEGVLTPPEIIEVSHSPVLVYEGETVSISAEILEYDTSIDEVKVTYCIGETCFLPIDMNLDGSVYTTSIGPFDADDVVKYNVLVEDDEGNELTSPDNTFTVLEVELQGDDDDDDNDPAPSPSVAVDESPSPFLLMAPIAVIIGVIWFQRKR